MNIQRFLLPASIAAAFHVALLWALPHEDYVRITAIQLTPVDPPAPPKPDDPVTLPVEKNDTTVPVQPLAGGPTPPDIPEPTVLPKPDALTIPLDPSPQNPAKHVTVIPPISGPGDAGINGPHGLIGPLSFRVGDLDRTPNAKVRIAPDYPYALKHEGISGTVVIEFEVDRTGQVVGAKVVQGSHREFEEAAVRAVLKWRFEPGRRNGQAVPFRMVIPIEFGIGED